MYSRRVVRALSKARCSYEILMCPERDGKIKQYSPFPQLAEVHTYIHGNFHLTESI